MKHTFKVLHLFSGMGGGAVGAAAAAVRVGEHEGVFETVGGVDFDDLSNRDFRMLAKAPTITADLHAMQPAELLRLSPTCPDAVILSPPCKGFSGLLSQKRAADDRYQKMNRLLLDGLFLLCSTWSEVPPLIFVENVPRIANRGGELLRQVKAMLHAHGYVLHMGTHNCGEIGGLAQNRMRWFMIARCTKRVPQFIYQPPKQRVRACGEVIGPLPMPGDPACGPMHELPRITWRNWVRLAAIPAGGDWRDLPGVVPEGKRRGSQFRRHAVADWDESMQAVVGPGGGSVENVADPRVAEALALGKRTKANSESFKGSPGLFGVDAWDKAAPTVTAGMSVSGSNTPAAVADPRFSSRDPSRGGALGVQGWDRPSVTVTGSAAVTGSNMPASVADPRFGHVDNVRRWDQPAHAVTTSPAPSSGAGAVADPRVPRTPNNGVLGVTPFSEPMGTIAGSSWPMNGKFSVADPRLNCEPRSGAYRVLSWAEAASTITGSLGIDNGPAAVADPRIPAGEPTPLDLRLDPDKPPPFTPIILSPHDGTWHRPMTTYELAALQGFPLELDGKPLVLAGNGNTRWREAIGNAIPPPASQAVAEQLLRALLLAKLGMFTLGLGQIWVAPNANALHAI